MDRQLRTHPYHTYQYCNNHNYKGLSAPYWSSDRDSNSYLGQPRVCQTRRVRFCKKCSVTVLMTGTRFWFTHEDVGLPFQWFCIFLTGSRWWLISLISDVPSETNQRDKSGSLASHSIAPLHPIHIPGNVSQRKG